MDTFKIIKQPKVDAEFQIMRVYSSTKKGEPELIKNRLAIERNNYAKGGWFVSIDLDVKYVETFEEAVALATAAMGVDLKACRDELCLYCGRYVNAHEGGCDGCRWKDL